MDVLKLSFLLSLFFLSSCKFQDNLLGDRPSIDAGHAPPLSGVFELGISDIPNQVIDEDTSSSEILFTITGAGLDCTTDITASSDDASIINLSGIVFASSGENCTVTLTPEANANGGPVVITVSVTNGDIVEETSFTLTVNAVSDPFTIMGAVADGQLLEVDDYGPDYDASSSHQWLANGVPIVGATSPTFTVTTMEEGSTITLSLDGQVSNNSLITEYFAVVAHENNPFQVTGNLNGVAMVYDNLVNTTDLGGGVLQFSNGPNSNYNKRASSTGVIKDVGDYFEFVNAAVPGFSGYVISWSPVATVNAHPRPNRIAINRGSNNHVVYIDGTVVYNVAGTAGTYRVTRIANGFEIRRNGVVLYSD